MSITLHNAARIAAVLAGLSVLAITAPLASAARKHSQSCPVGPSGWVTVVDDQGVANLVQADPVGCTTALACTAEATAAPSPYPGWVSITDDIGVPYLYPIAQSPLGTDQPCAQQPQSVPVAAPVPAAAVPTLRSPYPGWVIVTNDYGVPYLEPAAQAAG